MWERLKQEVARIRGWIIDTGFIAVIIVPWILGIGLLTTRYCASDELKKQIVYEFVKYYAEKEDE